MWLIDQATGWKNKCTTAWSEASIDNLYNLYNDMKETAYDLPWGEYVQSTKDVLSYSYQSYYKKEDAPLYKAVHNSIWYAANVMAHLTNIVGAGIKTGASLLFPTSPKKDLRSIALHLGEIALYDGAPLLMLYYLNEQIHHFGHQYIDKDNPYAIWDYSIKGVLLIPSFFTWVLATRLNLKMMTHHLSVTMKLDSAIDPVLLKDSLQVCEIEKCSHAQFLKGRLRGVAGYWATRTVIALPSYLIPYAGPWISNFLAVLHSGNYIMTLALPLCDKHEMAYLINNAELAVALGLANELASNQLYTALEGLSGLPALYYKAAFGELILTLSVIIAAHLPFVPAQADVKRSSVANLIIPIKELTDRIVNWIATHVKRNWGKEKSFFLRERIDWAKWLVLDSAGGKLSLECVLPEILQDKEKFIDDDLLKANWLSLKKNVLLIIDGFEKARTSWPGLAGQVAPTSVSYFASWYNPGAPRKVLKTAFTLMKQEDFIANVKKIRDFFEPEVQFLPESEETDQLVIPFKKEIEKDEEEKKSDSGIEEEVHPSFIKDTKEKEASPSVVAGFDPSFFGTTRSRLKKKDGAIIPLNRKKKAPEAYSDDESSGFNLLKFK